MNAPVEQDDQEADEAEIEQPDPAEVVADHVQAYARSMKANRSDPHILGILGRQFARSVGPALQSILDADTEDTRRITAEIMASINKGNAP